MDFDASKVPPEKGIDFPKLELKKDEVGRICILSTKGWVVTVRHWVKGIGYVHCHAAKNEKVQSPTDLLKIEEEGGRPEECILCNAVADGNDRVRPPQRRFALRVLRYRTDVQGKAVPGGLRYWLEIWIIDNRKYRNLHSILEEWGGENKSKINQHDLQLTCDDQQYQTVTINAMKNALWTQDKEGVKAYLKEEINKHDLMKCLGHEMEVDAIKRRLALLARRSTEEAPVDLDVADAPETPGAEASPGEDVFDFESKGGKDKGEVPAVVEESKEETVDFLDDVMKDKDE